MAKKTFGSVALKVLMIRPDERANVWLLFLHHFFQSIGIAFFYVAANAIFLHHFPVNDLATTYIISAIALLVVGRLYAMIEHHVPAAKFMSMVTIFVLASVLMMWVGLMWLDIAWMAIAIMVWYRIIYLLCSLEFWGMTSMLFNVRQGKRLFSLISVGDVLPKVLGYSSVRVLLNVMEVENLIPLAGVCLIISWFILKRIIRETPPELIEQQEDRKDSITSSHFLSQFFKNELIFALAGVAFLAMGALTFIDFSFLSTVKPGHQTDAEFANFLSSFFAMVYLAIIIIKIFLSSKIIHKFGIRNNLFVMPVALLLVSIAIFVIQMILPDHKIIIFLFSAMFVISEILKRSLHEPIFLTLFQPLSRKLRLHGHTIVKGLVEPLGLGLAGVILLIVNNIFADENLHVINYFLFAALIGWMIFTHITGKKYFKILQNAVNKRFIGGQEITITDKSTMNILIEKLKSDHPEEVIYSLELLQKFNPTNFNDVVISLLTHDDADVQMQALNKIETLKIRAALPQLKMLIENGNSTALREAAIRIYCSFENDVPENILPFLQHEDINIRKGAVIGLMKSGGIEAMLLAGQQLLGFINSDKTNERVLAAEVIGELKIKNFHQPIIRFLNDDKVLVKEKAIEASGRVLNSALIPYLVNFLDNPVYANKAMNALSNFDVEALSYFDAYLENQELFLEVEKILRICHICGHINHPKSGELLCRLLYNSNIIIRHEALINLVLINYSATEKIKEEIIDHLEEEFMLSAWCYNAYEALEHEGHYEGFRNALLLEINQGIIRIFNLLSLIYDPKVIKKARDGYALNSKEQKANAMEILDNHISNKIKSKFFTLLDDLSLQAKAVYLAQLYPVITTKPNEIIQYVLKQSDTKFNVWTQVIAIHSYAEINPDFEKNFIAPFYNHPYKILRDTAIHNSKLNPLNEKMNMTTKTESNQNDADSFLLEIEKVIVLKSTGIFRETPENVLVDISSIIHEERVMAGEVIFQKGDLGNCMYIIYDGQVKIHDGDNIFEVMKNRDFFGELALLDPEPRSASATAITDVL
ncbi:MAG: cyclic nucleotide-binding domain-containing protein, partial [Bacteroidota bacterium]